MKRSQGHAIALAVTGALIAAGVSACADIDRVAGGQTPYTLPAGGAVSSIYSASTQDSSYDASALSAARHREDKARGRAGST